MPAPKDSVRFHQSQSKKLHIGFKKITKVVMDMTYSNMDSILKTKGALHTMPIKLRGHCPNSVKGNVVRTNVYHKYIKDLKLNITIDLDGFIY